MVKVGVSSYAQEITNTMYNILEDERPLHRAAILARVQERGVYVGGPSPIGTIGSYLSTDDRFSNVGRGTWTLAEEPKPDLSAEMQNNHYVGEDNASEPSA